MKINYNKIIISIILLVFVQAGLIFLLVFGGDNGDQPEITSKISSIDEKKTENIVKHYPYFTSIDFYEEAGLNEEAQKKTPDDKVYGGIIPHHLAVKEKIAAFFKGIENFQYDRVVLIGPNHFDAGRKDIIISEAVWETPYGELKPDMDLVQKISALDSAGIEEKVFEDEHSISGLVGFIKKYLGDVKFTPIVFSRFAKENTCIELAEVISRNSQPEKTLVLASVDFSHYLPARVADFHDERSNGIVPEFV